MERRDFILHIETHGCRLLREGGRHSIYFNPPLSKASAVPRRSEIREGLVRKICKDLGIPRP
ncbi:MAG: YcfA family protein [Phycisphaerales bacterium]|nr:YcfA family protein [Phycisphaerales bacterium]MDB5303675.1 YcfA family protein [Phycisphaerales bacterium]